MDLKRCGFATTITGVFFTLPAQLGTYEDDLPLGSHLVRCSIGLFAHGLRGLPEGQPPGEGVQQWADVLWIVQYGKYKNTRYYFMKRCKVRGFRVLGVVVLPTAKCSLTTSTRRVPGHPLPFDDEVSQTPAPQNYTTFDCFNNRSTWTTVTTWW